MSRGEKLACLVCHVIKIGTDPNVYDGNPAVVQYLTEGTVTTTTWNPDASWTTTHSILGATDTWGVLGCDLDGAD